MCVYIYICVCVCVCVYIYIYVCVCVTCKYNTHSIVLINLFMSSFDEQQNKPILLCPRLIINHLLIL